MQPLRPLLSQISLLQGCARLTGSLKTCCLLIWLCFLASMLVGRAEAGLLLQQDDMGTPIKPQSDKLSYKIITLENNGLRAIIISDPETDKAAASLDVRVGSMLDPPELQGLAHFTEHMLFYSSEKFPVEDEYSKFISEHGGHTNAYTAAEDTNYQFDVNWDHLEPALERFAQFFICPLISEDGVEREVKAVDSEHGKNLNSDAWRTHQLNKHTGNQKNPWAKFFTGNKETLLDAPRAAGVDVRAAVAAFHASHYSANLMRLAVYGRQSLEELQQLVERLFKDVPNQQLGVPSFPGDVFLEEHRGQLLRVVPVKDGHVLEVHWDIPPTEALYRQAPGQYLSHLLGHEGEGSAFALLKARGWASSLSAGEGGVSFSGRSFFTVRVELTEAGHTEVAEVARVLFKYLDLLRAPGGINQQVFDEMRALQQLRFDWRDKVPPYSYTTSLSSCMQTVDDDSLLLALYHVPQVYDPEAIQALLDCLTPDAARVWWFSKSFAKEGSGLQLQEEPIYSTRYSCEHLPREWLAAWIDEQQVPGLHLPSPNPFVPTSFTLCPAPPGPPDVGQPQVLLSTPELRLLHRTELRFEVPKAAVWFDFQCPAAYSSPESSVLTRLLVKLLADYLNELTYPAELAGLAYHVTNTLTGFQIHASGYNHKLPVLLGLLLDKLAGFKAQPERFSVVAEALAKEYANVKYQQPYQWALYRSEVILNFRRWRIEEYEAVLPGLGPEDLTAFLPRLLSRLFLEVLVVGNMAPGEAEELAVQAQDKLRGAWGSRGVLPGEEKDIRVIKLPAGETSIWVEAGPNPTDDNSAALALYQVGPDDLRANALLQLLVQLGKRDAFYTLRTQEQLGYIVSMYPSSEYGVQGVSFILQSDKFSAAHLAARVEAFVGQLLAKLETLPDSEFAAGVEELAKAKLEKPKRLGELARRWWWEVASNTWCFDRQVAEVAELKALTQPELVDFAKRVLGPGSGSSSSSRRKMLVLVRCQRELQQQEPAGATASSSEAAAAEGSTDEGQCGAGLEGTGSGGEATRKRTQGTCDAGEAGAAVSSSLDRAGGTCPAATAPSSGGTAGAALSAAAAAAAAVGPGEVYELMEDMWSFKRGCEVYPSLQGRAKAAGFGARAAAAAAAAATAGGGEGGVPEVAAA